ncbi:sugar diacid recognition domain-containing protein [Pseudonocardia sp. H11422]|uniref:sugar diacid recognition domain-containing protein n=1 Tax=Pseudonocardia sp. H11422 TaxID=2835866 RepID=UPI003977304D
MMITDRHGLVLGNGDPTRVGTFHEASVDVVRTERPATHTAAQARRLTGVRPGITLPVLLDGEVVGTVGLTGPPQQVRRFGLVVRNQTELLLRESSLLTSRLVREKAVTDLLQDIAHHDPTIVAPQEVEAAAHDLGHDLRLTRVALVVDVERIPGAGTPAVLRTVRQVFHDMQDVVGTLGRSHVAVLHRLPRNTDTDAVLAAARRRRGTRRRARAAPGRRRRPCRGHHRPAGLTRRRHGRDPARGPGRPRCTHRRLPAAPAARDARGASPDPVRPDGARPAPPPAGLARAAGHRTGMG